MVAALRDSPSALRANRSSLQLKNQLEGTVTIAEPREAGKAQPMPD